MSRIIGIDIGIIVIYLVVTVIAGLILTRFVSRNIDSGKSHIMGYVNVWRTSEGSSMSHSVHKESICCFNQSISE